MGRWRPPPPASSPYITADGFSTLQEENNSLWEKRAAVVKALAAAAAEGDRSENAEYIYRKKELGGIDRRIRYLQKRLPNLNVVRDFSKHDKVYFGAWVSLEKDNGDAVEYRIVGPDETDARKGWISMDSPLAKVLLKRQVGDEVSIKLESGLINYCLTAIRYPES